MTGNQSIIPLEQSMKELTPPPVIALYPWGEIKYDILEHGKLQSTSVDRVTISSKLKKSVCGKSLNFVGVLLGIMIIDLVNSCRKFVIKNRTKPKEKV